MKYVIKVDDTNNDERRMPWMVVQMMDADGINDGKRWYEWRF